MTPSQSRTRWAAAPVRRLRQAPHPNLLPVNGERGRRAAPSMARITRFLIFAKELSAAARHRGAARIAATIAMVSTLTRATRPSRSTTFSL